MKLQKEKDNKMPESEFFEEGFTSRIDMTDINLRKKQIESNELNKIRMDRPKEPEKKGRKGQRKRQRRRNSYEEEEYGSSHNHKEVGKFSQGVHKPKRKTKHEIKLDLEQIREDRKAKRNPGYVAKNVYAEDKKMQEIERIKLIVSAYFS